MSQATIVSRNALAHVVDNGSTQILIQGDFGDPAIVDTRVGAFRVLLHRSDTDKFRFVLFGPNCDLSSIRERDLPNILARVRSLVDRAQYVDLIVPANWGPWRHADLIAFWAAPRSRHNRRWVAQVRRPSQDVCLWELGDSEDVDLAAYVPDEQPYFDAVETRPAVFASAQATFRARDAGGDENFDSVVLDAAAAGDVVGSLAYDAWLPRLTVEQRRFVEAPVAHSLKLRGPAGSGKTLSLELKAIREARSLAASGDTPRLLFLTHSWAMAGQVDAQLFQLDPSHAPMVEVLPLLSIAQITLPGERSVGMPTAGDDALESRELEIDQLAGILAGFIDGDWLTYRGTCSEQFVGRVESESLEEKALFLWDLIAEFGTVIGANGIFREPSASDRYNAISRSPWMMPLTNRSDRDVVYQLYRTHIEALLSQGFVSGDHVINDFLNYLSTFAWNIRRRVDGYDLVFVDELHLFTAQERLILKFISRDDTTYPKIFMSLDPRQSPWERYSPMAHGPQREEGLGEIVDVSLSTVHRFSPQVLALLRHINHDFPALDLGEDWKLDLDAVTSSAKSGPLPLVVSVDPTVTDEVTVLMRRVQAGIASGAVRQAIAIVDASRFNEFEAGLTNFAKRLNILPSVLTSREDSEALNYSRPKLVIAPAEYLAGLQFDRVLVAGLPRGLHGTEHAGYRQRRFLSLLYLAISRASLAVEVVYSTDEGIPTVLSTAIANKFAELLR